MQEPPILLSPKFKDFLFTITERDYAEGTTAAGKTTVGITKFMLMVARSDKKFHLIAGADIGTVEKNVINNERGLIEQFKPLAEYYSNGHGNIRLPHISYQTAKETKVIYVVGYDNKKRWQKVLGGQVGCTYIDEVNIANMEFLREITHRCEYMLTSSNPDDPDLTVYKEFINRSRPLDRYKKDYPEELLNQLNEPPVKGWVHWYFSFRDNAAITEEQIQKKIASVPPGTKMYKNKIQGLRGRATGLVFNNFTAAKNIVTKSLIKAQVKNLRIRFELFTSGLDTAYSQQSPDTFAFTFSGITDKGFFIVLDEYVVNNADVDEALAPSDIAKKYVKFLERNRHEWGLARDCYIDCADQATITELKKYKRNNPVVYNFINSYKKFEILDRIHLMLGWINTDKKTYYLVCEHCINHIKELNSYSWKEDKYEPEDKNDHTINSVQYSWIPYKKKIGIPQKGGS